MSVIEKSLPIALSGRFANFFERAQRDLYAINVFVSADLNLQSQVVQPLCCEDLPTQSIQFR